MINKTSTDEFGCAQCWPDSADAAWPMMQKTERGDDICDESHLHIMLSICGTCQQHFLWVFTEKIDWAAGDDPQHWAVLPLTQDEVKARNYALSYDAAAPLQPTRRSLQVDAPKGGGMDIFWSTGLFIGSHD